MTVFTPIRKGHGRLLTMYQSVPFRGRPLETAYAARDVLDPAECDQVAAVGISKAGRQAFTERV